jgi:hypothetical protein
MAKTIKKHWWRLVAIIAVMGFIAAALRPEPTQAQGDVQAQGGADTVAAPIQVNVANLPVVTGLAGGPVRVRPEQYVIPEAQFRAEKARASQGFGPVAPVTVPGGRGPALPGGIPQGATPGAVVSFNGDFQGSAGCGNWIPSDHALAVGDGSNPILQAVNECLSVFNLAGTRLLGPVALQTFFGRPLSDSVCDPRALYDWRNHRFILTAILCSAPFNASFVAVSQTNSPLGSWWVYTLPSFCSPGAIMDYPRMGQDHTYTYPGSGFAGGIYLNYNNFNPSYVGEEWKILPKGPMYVGGGFSYWNFCNTTYPGTSIITDSTQPANVWSPYERPRAEFYATARNEGGVQNQLTIWAVSNPFSHASGGQSPELSGVNLTAANTWTVPPDAPQPGGPNNIDTLDNRISGEVTYAHGHLHFAHASGNGAGGTMSEIYKVQPFLNVSNAARCVHATSAGLCPQITGSLMRNETVLNYGGTSAAFFPTPQPDLDGNVTTVYNYSTTADFPGVVYISQRVTQPLGSFVDSGIFLFQGQGQYTGGRWGDYTAVAPIGVAYAAGGATGGNGMVFAAQYSDSPGLNRWRTRIGANIFTSPAQAGPQQQTGARAVGDSVGR